MIAFEIALLVVLGIVIVAGIKSIAPPISQAYAEKIRFKYKDLGSEAETVLKERVSFLENEVRDLKQQLSDVQQTLDLVIKHNASSATTATKQEEEEDHIIHVKDKSKTSGKDRG
jgi:hypothetical protein